MVLCIVAMLATPVAAFAQDLAPDTDPTTEPEAVLPETTPTEVFAETLPIEPVNPDTSLLDVTQAVVDTAAALTSGDPSGVLGGAVYGAPAGAPFNYFPADGLHSDGTCDWGITTLGTLTCYWAAPIQSAVDDSAVGSTVSVAAGDYTEQVEINKNLTLQAAVGVTLHSPATLATEFTSSGENKPIIFVTGANNVNLDGFVINGDNLGDANSRFIGIAYYNAGGVISNNTILGITDATFSSDQQGVGILILNDDAVARSVTITGNEVSDYQKTGIEVLGSSLTASITNNTVTGEGTTPLTAQNGIEVGDGATGEISGNEVSANDFSGSGYTATGILEVGPSSGWTITDNYLHDNQTNLYLHEGNNIDVSGNIITGGTWGVVASSDTTGNLTATITNNTITANTVGVYADDPNINITLHQNNIAGNGTGVWFNDTKSTGGTLNASQNYWGCAAGANTPGCDTTLGSVNTGSPLAREVIHPPLDRTVTASLAKPASATTTPRYLSGFGSDDVFTVFYEDRKLPCAGGNVFRIVFNQTSTGPEGLSDTSTATDICDSHLLVKDWPFRFGSAPYAYRAWGAGTYSGVHNLYGSNDLVHWTKVSTFTIPTDKSIVDSQVLYGFHDVVRINNHYLAFAETAGGFTVIVESPDGLSSWTVVSLVGGSNAGNGPLNLLSSSGPKPTGNFVLMRVNGQQVYAKLMVPGDKRAAYLAINAAAAQAATPALAEAAFENPANWKWMDGTTGVPGATNAYMLNTAASGGHYIGEEWMIPNSDLDARRVIIYDAEYATGKTGLGCAADNPDCLASGSSDSPAGGPATVPGSFTSLELNPQIITTGPAPTPVVLPAPVTPYFIPVTGGVLTDLGCDGPATLLLTDTDGTQTAFNATLCGYKASLDMVGSAALPSGLPEGRVYAAGVTLVVQNGGTNVDVLPEGVFITVSFPKPGDLAASFAVEYWDARANGGAGGWVELPFSGPIAEGDARTVIYGAVEVDGMIQVTVNFAGTFILVSK